ncbi:MAG: Calx-beta domain-containing protein, partial [Chloroflexaceae bacterium]
DIRHQASSADPFYNRDVPELRPVVRVAIADDDTAALLLPVGPLTLTEGQTQTYQVSLATDPIQPVTVTLMANGPITVTPTSLVFSRNNRVRTVTITAPDNDVDAPDATATITHTIETADPVYRNLAPQPITVRVLDDDEAGLLVAPQLLRLTEAPGPTQAASYSVRLRTRPTAPVTVTLSFDQELVVEAPLGQVVTSPATLTFTEANWNLPQAVQVRAVDDAVDEDEDGNRTPSQSLIRHVASSVDPFYNRNAPELRPVVTVEITDNDTAGLEVAPPSGWTTSEDGDQITFTVRLTSQPVAPVQVQVTTSDATEGQISAPPLPLVFNALNWNQPVTVTVRGVDDDLYDGPIPYAIYLRVDPVSGYALLAGMTEIRLTNLDNDRVPASFVQAESVVREDAGEARLAVRLIQTLTYTVTVGYETFPGTATPDQDYTPVSGVLTFAPGDLVQTIVLPVLDNDSADEERYETVQVLLRAGESTVPGSPAVATVLIEEDGTLSPLEVAPFLLTGGTGGALQQGDPSGAGSRGIVGASFLEIALPCSWPAERSLTIELWSPAVHVGPGANLDVVDPEVADGPNTTWFELYDAGSRVESDGVTITPAGSGVLAVRTFAPNPAAEAWELLATVATPQPCGRYLLRAQTDGDDENYWAVRVGYDHDNSPLTRPIALSPLGVPVRIGTLLGSVEVRPPVDAPLCRTAWFYVPPGTATLLLNNFDLDEEETSLSGVRMRFYAPGQLYDPQALSGGIVGRMAGNGVWVQESILSPESGWWRVVVCSGGRNRYALEASGDGGLLPLLYDAPY